MTSTHPNGRGWCHLGPHEGGWCLFQDSNSRLGQTYESPLLDPKLFKQSSFSSLLGLNRGYSWWNLRRSLKNSETQTRAFDPPSTLGITLLYIESFKWFAASLPWQGKDHIPYLISPCCNIFCCHTLPTKERSSPYNGKWSRNSVKRRISVITTLLACLLQCIRVTLIQHDLWLEVGWFALNTCHFQ